MYRFGSALSEVYDFARPMRVGDKKTFSVGSSSSIDSIEKFRARLADVARDHGWIFITRKTDLVGGAIVRRIK